MINYNTVVGNVIHGIALLAIMWLCYAIGESHGIEQGIDAVEQVGDMCMDQLKKTNDLLQDYDTMINNLLSGANDEG